jgi:hypothetical protein
MYIYIFFIIIMILIIIYFYKKTNIVKINENKKLIKIYNKKYELDEKSINNILYEIN